MGGHGHGHGHGHGGRGGYAGGPWGPWWGGYGYDYPGDLIVLPQAAPPAPDTDAVARAMAFVMSLPKAKRAGAYHKIFGKPPAAGVLGDTPSWASPSLGNWMGLAAGAAAAYFLLRKKKRKNPAGDVGGFPWKVKIDGKTFASYSTRKEAEAWAQTERNRYDPPLKGVTVVRLGPPRRSRR